MRTDVRLLRGALAVGFLLFQADATLVPRLSFEQLTDASDLIVSGRITSSWTAWDREHKYLWTHYTLSVASAVKGSPAAAVEFAEPGGALNGTSMVIAGSVGYTVGDNMVVFLSRMPNGYLRTTGWAQGKYVLDANGSLHAQASIGAATAGSEKIGAGSSSQVSSLQNLEGMSLLELRQRVSARLRATPRKIQ